MYAIAAVICSVCHMDSYQYYCQLYSKEVIQSVLFAMRAHPGAIELLKEACALLWTMSISEEAANTIGGWR